MNIRNYSFRAPSKLKKVYEVPNASRFAPEGYVWVCVACGKWAYDSHGEKGPHSPGWDVSCLLNSDLYPLAEARKLEGLREPLP